MAITNFEVFATRLRDEKLDAKLKGTIALDLCESLELIQPQDYTRFVSILWPVIRDLLLKIPPVFVNSAPEQKLRSTLLEIIQRLPHNEVLRPIALDVVTTLISQVKNENEENAVLCLKIIYEVHRLFRNSMDPMALPFLELAVEVYRNADQMLKVLDTTDTPSSLSTPNISLLSPGAMSPGPDTADASVKNLSRSTGSFKVMTEIPIIVVSILQSSNGRRFADPFVGNILPLILHMLELNPRGNAIYDQSPGAQQLSLSAPWRLAYSEFITAQSKTLSFLAFFARGFTGLLIPSQDRVAQLTHQLLCACPADATAMRKEMLIATRHIVSTNLRTAFVPIAHRFLDMQVLVGAGLASQSILKPFAFSMLADLMHHIRSELSPLQLTKMVDFYSGCMHDQSLSPNVHTMCAKLLHNITECIMSIPDKRQGRILLLSILKTYVAGFAAIGCLSAAAINDIKSGQQFSEETLYTSVDLIRTNTSENSEKIKDLRLYLRSLVTGCKNVIYALKRCNSSLALGIGPNAQAAATAAAEKDESESAMAVDQKEPASTGASAIISNKEADLAGFELELLSSLFREGLRACRLHDVDRLKSEHADAHPDEATEPAHPKRPTLSRDAQIKLIDRECKEQIEHFANLFVTLDPAVFHELFTSQFEFAFDTMIEQCSAIASVQVLVSCEPTSPAFMSIMLRFLCNRLDQLGSDDESLTSTMLHLFKIAFLALTFFPEANEPVLQPYVQQIIKSVLTISKSTKKPENYFLLLRALFRSIGGGRYESLYKEVFPILQNLLETLNNALGFTKQASPMQELFVEICLTVPVRLSVLLPYLSLLMKPLVYALESGPELVSQGLRTLELCIDNLTREFLDPILMPVMSEIMSSLWLHLRLPSSASTHAPVAARILGKLGGRNRHMLLTRFPKDSNEQMSSSEDQFSVPLTFEGLPGLVEMPLTDAIVFSAKILEGRVPTKQIDLARRDAVEFVVSCARYGLVLPFVGKGSAAEVLAEAPQHGKRLCELYSNPMSLKRLANISSPSLQGSQILERTILNSPVIGNLDGLANNASMARPSLVSLTDSANAPPLNKNGLLHIIWSLSLATAHSEEATELLKTVTSLGAMQHIIHCVETAKPASQPSSPCSPTGLSQNSLGDVVPEAIARALIAESESLREIGCRMLLSFYTSLRVSLSDKVALVGQLPAMRRIVSEMCAACYSPSAHTKRSGCAGIAFIVKELDLGPNWLTDNLIELSKALLFTLKDTHTNALYDNTPISSRETILEIVQKAFPVPVPPLQPEPAPAHAPASKPVPMDTETDDKSVEPEGAGAGGGDDDDGDDKLAEEANDTVKEADKGMVTDTEKLTSDDTAMDVEKPTEDTKMDEDEPKDSEKGDEKGTDSSNKADQPEEAAGSDGDKSTEPAKDSEDEPKKSEGDASVKEEETPKPEPSVSKPKSDTSASRHQTPDASTPKPNTPTATPQQTQQAAQALHAQQAQQTVNTLAARMSLENSRLVMSFLALIIKELANPSAEVRDTVKACMDILVKVTGLSITALLTPCRDRLLVPIFGKPLRALPHNMQIGNIDAITYCMSLEPPFMEINEELMRLLSEALALADAEDQALVNHPAQIRSNTVSLTHLRHVCIRMLTAAMDRPELSQSRHNTTRARIISVFFKSLYHKSIDVVEAANDGLRQVLQQQQKLPKDLLQAGLRPILLNLSDYKRLTVASLDGLARLLQLLTNYFKVEVGRKLLDHMQQWANPQLLQAASSKAIDDLHEIKILVAILQVFHLLPTSANVLLDDLVSSVVNLEVNLCRRESSPFREPLFKFLTRYPNESVLYFMGRIENTHYARIFAHALRSPKCDSLREALVGLTPNIIKVLKSVANAEPKSEDTGAMAVDAAAKDAQPPGQQQSPQTATSAVVPTEATYKRLVVGMHTMTVIHAGLERNPKWIETRPDLLQAMIEVWNAIAAVPTQADQAHRLAKICFLEHYIASLLIATRTMSNPPAVLFKLLEACGRSADIVDTHHIFRYVWDELIVKWPISKRREILIAFMSQLGDTGISADANAILMQRLINPLVSSVFSLPAVAVTESGRTDLTADQRGTELLRGNVLLWIHKRVWIALVSSGHHMSPNINDSVRLEMVRLSSALIRNAAGVVTDSRKDIIKFGWQFIRDDDILIKYASYVLVTQFIVAFQTPVKIVSQAYTSLLKAHHVENRVLVRQALDILMPVLPERLSNLPQDQSDLPSWARWAKRVLFEQSVSVAHTTHIYQLIAAHPTMFYPYRMQFATSLVGILQKMCLTHSATTETRTLALDIMDLFLKWHAMQEKESKPSSSSSSVSPAAAVVVDTASAPDAQDGAETAVQRSNGTANGTPPAPDLLMTEARRETIVGLLLRMLCLVFDFALKSTLGPRALELLSSYLDTSKWPPMHLRLTFFERSISQIEQQGMNHQLVLHILTVLSTVTKHMQPGWFEEYYSSLVTIVRKCISVENTQVQRIIATLLRQLYEQAADNERLGSSNIVADLRALVESLIMENLQSNTNLFGTLMILHATGKYIGEQFYSYIPTLMKFVQKYTKEHNNHSGTAAAATVQTGPSGLSVQTSASSVTGVGSATSTASPSKLATTESEIVATLLADKSLTLTVEGLVRGEKSLDTLLMLVLLLKDYISRLGDQRRSFLTYIIQLIERSSDPCLLHVVLAVVREWVLDPQEVFPTIKEKAMLMSSMMSFVHGSVSANDNTSRTNARAAVAAAAAAASSNYLAKPAAGAALDANGNVDMFSLLERKYLSLVLEVYNDPRFTRSEMTMRLEQAFLSGMQSEDSEMRHRFLDTFDANMPPSLPVRLNYLLETQNWESVSSTFWLQQCLPLLFASTHQQASLRPFVMRRIAGDKTSIAADHDQASKRMDVDTDSHMDVDMDGDATADAVRTTHTNGSGEVEDMDMDTADNVASHSPVANGTSRHDAPSAATTNSPFSVGSIVRPLTRMVLLDTQFACNVWVKLFPLVWHNLSSKDQHDLTSGIIRLLAKPYHQAQTASRPNVIQAILDACCMCTPMPRLPPQLLRYLGQTYGAWYSSLAILEHKILDRTEIESAIFDRAMGVELGAFDALTELYTTLSASHYFYGAWKRHGQYRESHIALAYEQLDDWANAQASYEQAQTRARAGVLPFSESEYCLWESRWVETTRRLQSWDMLLDLGAHESLPEIELDAGWRQWSWPERQPQIRQLIKATPAEFVGSARAKFYETYLSLIKNGGERAKTTDFQRMCKDGIRLCLQQWNELPPVGTPAHINILHMFQLMVELGDASSIYLSLATTKAENLEVKSTDLKSVLQTWRERLPNNSDPINIWSDLVTWRQHIFKAINDVYVPFIPQQGGAANEEPETPKAGNKKGGNKADAKGNRKNDAAKEDTPKSATPANSTLTSFAYRGYHEMAWIINRFAHVARLHGLIDVCISSLTRIYTLPNIEIQEAFLKLREQAKCYYDREEELQSGLDVISNTNLMYFQQYQKAEFFTLKGQFLTKLGKLEDANHAFAMGIQVDLASAKAWGAWGRHNDYRFNMNLSDTTQAVNAISCYMQAAGLSKRPRVRRYLARTLWLLGQDDEAGNVCTAFDNYKSEMPTWYWIAFIPQLLVGLDTKYSRQSLQILLRIAKQYPQALHYSLRTAREESLLARRQQQVQEASNPSSAANTNGNTPNLRQEPTLAEKIDELMSKLKTAHPLLTLSMESMIDQIVQRLKPFPEEDIYRLVHALLGDGLQQLHARVSQNNYDMTLLDTIVSNTCRVARSLPSGVIKTHFEKDFGRVHEMDLRTYVTRLHSWQTVLRTAIRKRPSHQMLSHFSPFLVEFEQQKFEDVEVPGQYLMLTDNNDEFVRIERFMPQLTITLGTSNVSRRLTIRGTDGSIAHFAVQQSTSKHNHQEERWVQLCRNLDRACEEERDVCEQRRLALHLPTIVSLAPHIRLVKEQPRSFTLQDVYDEANERSGSSGLEPVLYFVDKMRDVAGQVPSAEEANRVLFEQTCQRFVPSTLLSDNVRAHSSSPMAYWLYRESFSFQVSVSMALTYMIASTQRTPAKLTISRDDGSVCLTDLVPTQGSPGLIHSKEPVPFRLTPNIQAFVTELGLEGILPFAVHKVADRFVSEEYLLRDFLDLYVTDELLHMPSVKALAATNPQALVEMCERNVQLITHRVKQLVEILPAEKVRELGASPMQPLLQLFMQAVDPTNLAKMDFLWMPWL